MTKKTMKSTKELDGLNLSDENGIEQPSKEQIQKVCEGLKIPFNKETAMAIIYGDNIPFPERILPSWLKELK